MLGRHRSSVTEPGKTQLHTIIFFPVDYDDPDNQSIAEVHHGDNSLSTGPHKDMIREPAADQRPLTGADRPGYFQDAHFHRVQRRLRSIYFVRGNGGERGSRHEDDDDPDAFNERGDTYATEQGEQRFLHQMPVFMEMLRERSFRTIYARNLQSALRHARRLKELLDPSHSPLEYRNDPKTPKTPKSLRSDSIAQAPLSPHTVPEQKVMILAYRMIGSRIHMDTRAYDAHTGESVVLYPSREEVGLDNAKVPDLRAFDAIAKKYGHWPPRWHRCDLSGNTPCEFDNETYRTVYEGKPQILKRGHSSCSSKVSTIPWNHYREPACRRALQDFSRMLKDEDLHPDNYDFKNLRGIDAKWPGLLQKKAENHILHNSRFFNYIHQEYVGTLKDWGELRVFIAMKYVTDANGTKKGQPEVVDIIRTHFNTEKEKKEINRTRKAGKRTGGGNDKSKGYGVDYEARGVTRDKLRGYCRARGLSADGWKAALITRLQDNDTQREQEVHAKEPAPEDEGAARDDPHLEGSAMLNEDIPIIRCTYQSNNMNVSRLNLDSTQAFDNFPKITVSRIENFALSQYTALHKRYPKQFESFNVGARIDIGIGPKQSLFINEVTRWWFASWFSGFEDLGRQHTVAQAFADSFAEVFRADEPASDEDDPESGDDEDDYDDDMYRHSAMLYKKKKQPKKNQGTKKASKRPQRRPGCAGNGGGDGGGDDGDDGPEDGGDDAQPRPTKSKSKSKKSKTTKKSKAKRASAQGAAAAANNNVDEGLDQQSKAPRRKRKEPQNQADPDGEDDGQGDNAKKPTRTQPRRGARNAQAMRAVDDGDGEDGLPTAPPRKRTRHNPDGTKGEATANKSRSKTAGGTEARAGK